MDVNTDTKPMDSAVPATSPAAATGKKPAESQAAEAAAAAMGKESPAEAAAVEPTANEGRYHPGAVKPNDSRLLSPAKKKALFASMGAKISDQKHTQEPPPPRAAARPHRTHSGLDCKHVHGHLLCRPRRDIQPKPSAPLPATGRAYGGRRLLPLARPSTEHHLHLQPNPSRRVHQ